MVKRCVWGTCNSDDRYKHKPHMSGVEFFPIPKPKTRLEETLQWVKACGRKDYAVSNVNKHAYVCSKHFVDGRPTTQHPYPIMATPLKQTVHKSRKLPFDRATVHIKASITTPTTSKIVDQVWRDVGAYVTLNGSNTSKDQPLQATPHFCEELKVDADHTYYAVKRGFNVQTTSISTQTDITMAEMDSLTDNMMDTGSMKRKNLMNDIMKDNKSCKFYTGVSLAVFCFILNFLRKKASSMVYWNSADTSERENSEYLSLDGNSLSLDDLVRLGKGHYLIKMTVDAEQKVQKARDLLEDIVDKNKLVYGITTGFGKFARVNVEKDKLNELQENLIRSHAAGVGPPLSPERTRMLLALRINVLTKGYSGISMANLKKYIKAFNASCLPWIPEKGTVGASGDLAPLSHLALGMMGEGKMWSPKSGWADAKYVLEFNNLEPIQLGPKEGLALINGTQLIAALGAEALERAESISRQADVVAAFTLDVLKGTTRAFDSNIHSIRPHKGQINVASRLRSLLHSDTHPSEIAESHRFCDRVQDAYTLRCCPQVHGIVNDTIDFVKGILTTEINSATDNPMVFADRMEIISGGNFHGEYPAKALDYLAIGVHELANMSERRIERLVNPAYSELPAFLTPEGGLNSGFMIAHCTAAALVSENKVLCHPASVDSLTTSAGTEDHVSMGGFAARKCLRVVEHVEQVIAIELLSACQAMEFLRPLKSTPPLEEVYKLVRSVVGPWTRDRYMAPDIEAATKLLQEEKVWYKVKPFIDNYHSQQHVETRVFSPTAIGRPEGPVPKRRKTTSLSRRN